MHKVETRAFCSARPGRDQRVGAQKVRTLQTRRSSLFIVIPSKNGASPFCSSNVIAFGSNPRGTDETWCIDTRGVLTLSIDGETYQRLGLLGTPLPWRPHQNRHSTCTPSLPESAEYLFFLCDSRCVVSNSSKGAETLEPAWPQTKIRPGVVRQPPRKGGVRCLGCRLLF